MPPARKASHEPHRSPGMRAQPGQIDILPHVLVAREIGRRPRKAVMHDRQIVLLRGAPDRFEIRVIDRPVVVEQGLHRDRPLRIAPFADFAHRLGDAARRGHDRALEPVRERPAEFVHEAVVGTDQPDFERNVGQPDHTRPHGGDEKMHVRALGIHVEDAVVGSVVDHPPGSAASRRAMRGRQPIRDAARPRPGCARRPCGHSYRCGGCCRRHCAM